ncbi:uncharacterized protein LOC127736606 [Mytilus californianus]|uniref:uncharacterized protein LOC127736606 n=1 Tax=Mytilus californianus TaxID=6549 RepID=UPI002245CC87|nr:uncharacterized protein LOC127736606 [Mytilus californianus]
MRKVTTADKLKLPHQYFTRANKNKESTDIFSPANLTKFLPSVLRTDEQNLRFGETIKEIDFNTEIETESTKIGGQTSTPKESDLFKFQLIQQTPEDQIVRDKFKQSEPSAPPILNSDDIPKSADIFKSDDEELLSEKNLELDISKENVIVPDLKPPIQSHQRRLSDTDHFLPEQFNDNSSHVKFQKYSQYPTFQVREQKSAVKRRTSAERVSQLPSDTFNIDKNSDKNKDNVRINKTNQLENKSVPSNLKSQYSYHSYPNTINMASALKLEKFEGAASGQAALNWLSVFQQWCQFYELSDQKKASSFPFHLEKHAKIWYDTLSEKVKMNYTALMDAFKKRFKKASDTMDLSVLQCTQKKDESSSDYLSRLSKIVTNNNIPEAVFLAVAMNGLNSGIKALVITKEPKNIEELRHAAQLAENATSSNTNEIKTSYDNVLSEIKSLKDEIKSVNAVQECKTDEDINSLVMATSPYSPPNNQQQPVIYRDRQPQRDSYPNRPFYNQNWQNGSNPNRPFYNQNWQNGSSQRWGQNFVPRQFDQNFGNRGRYQGNRDQYQDRRNPNQDRRNFGNNIPRGNYNGTNNQNQKCFYCLGYCRSRYNCPAKEAQCHECGKRGHFSKACLSARKSQF